jgi:hypothetical protein
MNLYAGPVAEYVQWKAPLMLDESVKLTPFSAGRSLVRVAAVGHCACAVLIRVVMPTQATAPIVKNLFMVLISSDI